MTGPETIALRVTKIGDIPRVDHFTVIWRGMPIGRIHETQRQALVVGLQVYESPIAR